MKSTIKASKPGTYMETKLFDFNPKAEKLSPQKFIKSVTFTSFAQNSFVRKKIEKENISENKFFEITKEISKKENLKKNWSPGDQKYESMSKFIPSFKPIAEKKGFSERDKKIKLIEKQKKNIKVTKLKADELEFMNSFWVAFFC